MLLSCLHFLVVSPILLHLFCW